MDAKKKNGNSSKFTTKTEFKLTLLLLLHKTDLYTKKYYQQKSRAAAQRKIITKRILELKKL
jgi:hypothetical protein